jgi:hypothetical protein
MSVFWVMGYGPLFVVVRFHPPNASDEEEGVIVVKDPPLLPALCSFNFHVSCIIMHP